MVFNGIKCLPDIMAGTLLLSVTVFVFIIIIIILTMVSEQVKGSKGEKKDRGESTNPIKQDFLQFQNVCQGSQSSYLKVQVFSLANWT